MFEKAISQLKKEEVFTGQGSELPDSYDPTRHYNCFIETVPEEQRQAVYQDLRRRRAISASHILPDGRLQMSLTLNEGIKSVNEATGKDVAAFRITKARFFELMLKDPNMEIVVLQNPGQPVSHAVKIRISNITSDSDSALYAGIECQFKKEQYREAVRFYDKAINIEPDDLRAWNNKIVALGQSKDYRAALKTADEALSRFPEVGTFWELKALALISMGRVIEAGPCITKACRFDGEIARRY